MYNNLKVIIHHIRCKVNTLDMVYDIVLRVNNMKNFVERIRELREDNDLTQKQIAEILQTTQQVYSRYENGANEIPVRHIITLARYYNVTCDYILGESDNPQK